MPKTKGYDGKVMIRLVIGFVGTHERLYMSTVNAVLLFFLVYIRKLFIKQKVELVTIRLASIYSSLFF
jgi:hypothetical protein